jgi:AraC-like DNA-binding protein
MFFLAISQNILLFFSALGTLQGVLLALILYFHPKSDRTVNLFLSLYIFWISIPSITLIVQYLFSWHIIIFVQPFLLLIGPLLYLYIRSFKEAITWRKTWPHLILFFLFLIAAYWLYSDIGAKYPRSENVPKELPRHPVYYSLIIIRSIQRLVYYFLARNMLISYQRSIQQLYSETSRINLHWVKWLVNGYLLLVLLIISFNVFILIYPEQYSLLVLIIGVLVTIYVYMAAVKGIFQSTLWQVNVNLNKEQVEAEIKQAEQVELKRPANKKPITSETKINEIVSKLNSVMKNEKLYQETELTLQQLAEKIKSPSYQVSQAINERMGKNFYDLVNGYRVEEAKRLLADSENKNYTILSVGFEAGFNSKTTFNTVFKKFTGLTPTEYRDKQQQTLVIE